MTVLTLELPAEQADGAAGLLHLGGAAGVEVRDGEQLPPPGVAPLTAGRAELRGYFAEWAPAERAARTLAAQFGGAPTVEELPATDWSNAWKDHFRPMRRGRILVIAPWMLEGLEALAEALPPPAATVVIDPGLAFGTGDHPTTGLCLEALDRFLAAWPQAPAPQHPAEDLPGNSPEPRRARVLDVGTGSAILAIAARKLGAGRTVATDNDPVALRVARENAQANRVSIEIQEALPAVPFDLVLANILANTLVELAGTLSQAVVPGGRLVLSGLLTGQIEEVMAAFRSRFRLSHQALEGGWACLELTDLVTGPIGSPIGEPGGEPAAQSAGAAVAALKE